MLFLFKPHTGTSGFAYMTGEAVRSSLRHVCFSVFECTLNHSLYASDATSGLTSVGLHNDDLPVEADFETFFI